MQAREFDNTHVATRQADCTGITNEVTRKQPRCEPTLCEGVTAEAIC